MDIANISNIDIFNISGVSTGMAPEIIIILGLFLNITCALFHKKIKPRFSNILTIVFLAACAGLSFCGVHFLKTLIYLCAFLCSVFSIKFTKRLTHKVCYFNALLCAVVLGSVFLVGSTNFLTMFVSLEIVSISSYLLVAIFMTKQGLEASVKYFIQGAVASCLMLFAISYLYALFGSINFEQISQMAKATNHFALLPIANVILFCAVAFKLAVVPFCSWVSEVLEGADYSVGLILSTVVKIAAVGLVIKLAHILVAQNSIMQLILVLCAVLTLVFSNLLAMRQKNIKRFLGYSTISHAGYILLAVAMLTGLSFASAVFYLVTYIIASFGIWAGFGIFYLNNKKSSNLEDMRSTAFKNPYYATMMSICLFSLAGMPPMLGFVGKFYLFVQVLSGGIWTTIPMSVVIFASVIALYYYSRIIMIFYRRPEDIKVADKLAKKTTTAKTILTVASFSLILLIFFSKPIIELCMFR